MLLNRNMLIRNNLKERLFAQVVGLLAQRGLILKKGTIVDYTFIESPSVTKNQKKERDSEAHLVKTVAPDTLVARPTLA